MKRAPLKRGSGLQRKVGMACTALSRNKRASAHLAEKRNLTRRRSLRSRPDPIDAKFSLMVRERAGWICARCKGDFSERKYLLHCSHFFSRNRYAVRFDSANCIALCGPCHIGPDGWEYQKLGAYYDFMVERLGAVGFASLTLKATGRVKLCDAKREFIERWKCRGDAETRA